MRPARLGPPTGSGVRSRPWSSRSTTRAAGRRDLEPISWPVWRLASVIVFGAFMSGLDASVVNIGLDTIARDLDASLELAQWVANGYLLALAVSLPGCAWLGRRVGVGRLWLLALAGFTLTSTLCALAGDIGWLIGLRVAQGLTAGVLIPAGQTVLGQAVGPLRLGRVMASLGVVVTLAPALGPTVGGLVVHAGSWQWLFLVNLPLGVAGLILGLRYIPRGISGAAARLDWAGLLLLSTGVPALVYGLTTWAEQRSAATPGVVAPVGLGLLAVLGYARHAGRRRAPLLDLGLFANPTYAAAALTAGFTGAAMFGAQLLFPLYFQIGRDQDVLSTGLLLMSLGLGTAVTLPWTGRLVDRLGGGVVSVYGGLAAVATTAPFAVLDLDTHPLVVQGLLVARGAALALAVMPAGTAAYKAVTTGQLPDATAQVNILMRLGGALGGALFATILAVQLVNGPAVAFHTAFWWLTAASLLGLLSAACLARAERHQQTPDADHKGEPR
jgi:EmrB/QacA subfamily drug resistance transporter